MASALEYVLPLLQQGLPASVDFDWTREAVAKVQDDIAEAERGSGLSAAPLPRCTHEGSQCQD